PRGGSGRRRGCVCWRGGPRIPNSPPTRTYRRTRGCGRRCRQSAAAPGAAASSAWERLSRGSRENFDRDVGEPAEPDVVGQENVAPCFHRGGQVQGVRELEAMSGADHRGPVTDRRTERHHDIHSREEGVELPQNDAIAGRQGPYSTLQADEMA